MKSQLMRYFEHSCDLPDGRTPGEQYECAVCRRTWVRQKSKRSWMSEHPDDDFEIIGVTVRYGDGSRASFPG